MVRPETDWRSFVADRPRPGVVATDLDGTLLRSDGHVSPYTRDVFARHVADGGEFVIVTARPRRWLRGVAGMVPPGGQIIASNGAYVVDAASGDVVVTRTFAAADVAELIGVLRAAFPGIALGAETEMGLIYETTLPVDASDSPGTGVADLAAWLDTPDAVPVGKLLGRCADIDPGILYEVVAPVVGERGHLAFSGAAGLLEMSAVGVTKAAALREWCVAHGHGPEDVWAFGDMPNDLPMMSFAGTTFAPANAHAELLAVVDAVVPHHDEDGVAQAVAASLDGAPSGR